MPKASPSYHSFTSGELSPMLYGRTDLEQYYKGSKECLNMLCTQYGPLVRRSGSIYRTGVTGNEKGKIITFNRGSRSVFFILTNNYIQMFDTDITQKAHSATTYTTAQIPDIQYVQSKDTITLTHRDHKPKNIVVNSISSTFTINDVVLTGNPYKDENLTSDTVTPSAINGSITVVSTFGGSLEFTADYIGTFMKIGGVAGTPEKQGTVKITSLNNPHSVNAEVINLLDGVSATTVWAESAWSNAFGTGWPSKCAYFQKRLIFANTVSDPNGWWGSKQFIYDNFDAGTGLADDALSESLPEANDISWILGAKSLLFGTDVGDIIVSASTPNGAITPQDLSATKQTGWGSEAIQPKFIGSYAYYAQLKGRKIREIYYEFRQDSYKANDMTAVSEHITESGVIDMAYQRNPYSILYCILANGNIATMTREPDQQALGWSKIYTNGNYESIGSIPHPTEDYDIVFVLVNRKLNGADFRTIERFTSPLVSDSSEDMFYVDSGKIYNSHIKPTTNTLTLSGTSGNITATASTSFFTSDDVGRRLRAIDSSTGAIVGQMNITGFTSGTEITGTTTQDFEGTTYPNQFWGVSTITATGFTHLISETVNVLVDGRVIANKVVNGSGEVILDEIDNGYTIIAGLPYTSRWENMPIESGSATGTSQGKKKRIYQSGFRVTQSYGMDVGSDVNHLKPMIQPTVPSTEVEPLYTGLVSPVKIDSTYDYEGHIVIQQTKPLPMTIVAVYPLLQTNDK